MSTKDTQARLLDGPSGESVSIETDGRTIRPALELPSQLVDECKARFDEDGIQIRAVDPANVGMVDLQIHTEAFDGYALDASDGLLVGLDLGKVESKLSKARLGRSTNDPISMDFDEGRTLVEIVREYASTEVTYTDEVLNIDPDAVRQELDLPDLDLSATATVDTTAFRDGVLHIKEDSDHLKIQEVNGDLAFTRSSKDDESDGYGGAVRFNDAAEADEDADDPSSKYSLDYLANMAKALKQAKVDEVQVRWGQEFPMKIHAERTIDEETAYSVTYMLAPRIESGGSS